MSDEWINQAVARMKQHDEEKARAEKYALLREQQIGMHEFHLFEELQNTIKAAVEKFNQHFQSKRLTLRNKGYDRFEIETSFPDVSLSIRYQSDHQMLEYFLYKPSGDEEGKVTLELTKGELHYVLDKKPSRRAG